MCSQPQDFQELNLSGSHGHFMKINMFDSHNNICWLMASYYQNVFQCEFVIILETKLSNLKFLALLWYGQREHKFEFADYVWQGGNWSCQNVVVCTGLSVISM
jgi:hypothetical protein